MSVNCIGTETLLWTSVIMHREQLPAFLSCSRAFLCLCLSNSSFSISLGLEINVIFMNTSWPGCLLGFKLILLV